jgi:DNA end-binding protein Ku
VPSSIWTGAISFGLVSIAVRLYPATESKSVRFNLLHKKDGSRIQERYYCPEDGQVLESHEIVRGYPIGAGRYVALDHGDFAKIPVKSLHTIEITEFVKLAEIDPILFQHTYYLAPEEIGAKPFALLRRTIQDSGLVAVGRLTLREKEHACVLRCYGDALALSVLFAPDEVRSPDDLGGREVEVDPKELAATTELIEALTTTFRPEIYTDPYREAMLAMINEKAATLEKSEPEPRPSALPDLHDRLKTSGRGGAGEEGTRRLEDKEARRPGSLKSKEGQEAVPRRRPWNGNE